MADVNQRRFIQVVVFSGSRQVRNPVKGQAWTLFLICVFEEKFFFALKRHLSSDLETKVNWQTVSSSQVSCPSTDVSAFGTSHRFFHIDRAGKHGRLAPSAHK
jgi:hypothetical protein